MYYCNNFKTTVHPTILLYLLGNVSIEYLILKRILNFLSMMEMVVKVELAAKLNFVSSAY